MLFFAIYDAKVDRIYEGKFIMGRWQLFYEDHECTIHAKVKKGILLPTDRLFIIGDL